MPRDQGASPESPESWICCSFRPRPSSIYAAPSATPRGRGRRASCRSRVGSHSPARAKRATPRRAPWHVAQHCSTGASPIGHPCSIWVSCLGRPRIGRTALRLARMRIAAGSRICARPASRPAARRLAGLAARECRVGPTFRADRSHSRSALSWRSAWGWLPETGTRSSPGQNALRLILVEEGVFWALLPSRS